MSDEWRVMRGGCRRPASSLLPLAYSLLVVCLMAHGGFADQPADQPPSEQESMNWSEVIARLRQEMHQRPGHAQTRQQLAIAYNNDGVRLSEQGEWTLAVTQLQEAIRLDAANEQFRNNLRQVYLQQAQDGYARHQLNEAIRVLDQLLALAPDVAQAYALRGQIEYDRQRLKEAKAAWERALELDPSQTSLSKRLEQLNQELPIESSFERLSQAYFDVRYEEALERPVGFDVRDALLEARRSIGSNFAYWPKHKFVVLVYTAEQFQALRRQMPDWVGAYFDGKIRMPLPSDQLDQATVEQILFHEYTHAVIHDLTNGTCPLWLNEGLAEYEGRTQRAGSLERLAAAHRADALIPWAELSERISTTRPAEEVAL
ncbi:MAG: tetratricopeptide repeat protein, partial [Candidatus Omnitrophota bacterium]|nr:tetratricopeptide repeat protein [Candidatus Omnitrophota bacterium]